MIDDQPRTITVMADYSCYPLWIPDVFDNVSPHDPSFALTPDLAGRLDAWAAEFDGILCWDDPASSAFPSEQAEEAFYETGEALARQLAGELGPRWKVRYHDGRIGARRDIP